MVRPPVSNGTAGAFHSLPQRSQKKLKTKAFSSEWSIVFRVSGLLMGLILTQKIGLSTCKIYTFGVFIPVKFTLLRFLMIIFHNVGKKGLGKMLTKGPGKGILFMIIL
jgi:fatty acid desaturase